MDLVLSHPCLCLALVRSARLVVARPQELRIDVDPPSENAHEQELDTLHGRLYTPSDRLYGLPPRRCRTRAS